MNIFFFKINKNECQQIKKLLARTPVRPSKALMQNFYRWSEYDTTNQHSVRITSSRYKQSRKLDGGSGASCRLQSAGSKQPFCKNQRHLLIKKKRREQHWKLVLDFHLPLSFSDYTTLHLGSSRRRDRQKFSPHKKRQSSFGNLQNCRWGNLSTCSRGRPLT